MLDGQILRDPHLQFGTQMGHIVIQAAGGRLCLTGARGTATMLCSATALAMAVRDGLQRGIPSMLRERYFADPGAIDCEAVFEAVSHKDRLCLDELRHWTTNLGWLLVSTVHVYSPDVIILSGGATHGARHFLKPLREQVNKHIFRYPAKQPVPIVVSRMQDHAGVLRCWSCCLGTDVAAGPGVVTNCTWLESLCTSAPLFGCNPEKPSNINLTSL